MSIRLDTDDMGARNMLGKVQRRQANIRTCIYDDGVLTIRFKMIDALHKKYVGELDERVLDLLKERGQRGSFETMITESRTGDVALIVGRDSTASRIGLLRELDTYEKDNNINLYDYLN